MLTIIKNLKDLDFDKLMEIYIEGNEDNAEYFYPALPKAEGVKRAEADFRGFLEKFFARENVLYAVWEEHGEYVSALRLEPYEDGLLLEALETKPGRRKMGCACTLIEAVKAEVPGRIYAHISKRNTASLRTHEKCGFTRILEHAVYPDGDIAENQCTVCLIR